MLVLYLLGRDVESIIGQRQFLFLYLAGAAAGELGHLFLMPSTSVLFAASGGVAAVLLAYATILPELELTSMLFLLVPVRLKAKYLAYAALGDRPLGRDARSQTERSRTALISGGIVAGWFYAHLLGFGRASILQRALRRAPREGGTVSSDDCRTVYLRRSRSDPR